MTIFILHTFSILSAPSMIEFSENFDKFALIDLVDDAGLCRQAVNSYPPTYPGVKSILHTFSILSAPSMIEFFKTLKNCLNLLSI